ncbi:MAG TPA: hypothetical protein VKF36_06085 [Syntrophorhabdales bacterium]|nr:hypothetical protein [Syntrophorhabdales bacterium]
MFGIVEHFLWPERATDKLRARLAEILKLLAELARRGACGAPPAITGNDVDSCRRLIAQKVEDAQILIESSKFEPGAPEVGEEERLIGEAQTVFVLLLTLARQRPVFPDAVRVAAREINDVVATALLAIETQVVSGSPAAIPNLEDAMDAFEHSAGAGTTALGGTGVDSYLSQLLALYRSLVEAVKGLFEASQAG